jgi:predicted aminopeptidase
MKRLRLVSLSFALPLLAACAVSPSYYWQAAGGQYEIWHRARPISDVISDPATEPALRQKLELATEIRHFASSELGLPDNASFRSYADLARSNVVWNVFAAPPLSMKPKEWCVPVAGCIAYLGFFAEADARAYADALRAQGLDVHIGGVPAYSTLGWFADPMLSTFIQWPETELARLIFHELAHQIVYVKDDSEFNESFATAVEEAGIRRWLEQPGKGALTPRFEQAQRMRADFADLVLRYRGELEQLYASDRSDADKLAAKRDLIDRLHKEYALIKTERWNGFGGYDRWFGQDINNATLASVGLYKRWVPAFTAMLARDDGNLTRFFADVRKLAGQAPDERRRFLANLATPPTQASR